MFKDDLKYAYRTFISSKLRTFLTMVGVFIGIAAIVSLISLGLGLQESIEEQFREIGADKIFITPGTNSFGPAITTSELTDKDVDTIEKVPGVKETATFLYKTDKVSFNDKDRFYFISSFPTDNGIDVAIEALGADVSRGRIFDKGESGKAIIGWKLFNSQDPFGRKVQIGDSIRIQGEKFEVIGVFESRGNDADDTTIFIPQTSYTQLYGEESFDWIIVQTDEGQNSLEIAKLVERKLRQSRGLEEGEEDFVVQTFDQLLDSFGTIFTVVNIVLAGIASISLVVAGIGIMNTMYTSVLERRQEIGIMKAVGAKNQDILRIFLIESVLLGLLGGIVGLLIGISLVTVVDFFARKAELALVHASYSPFLLIGALIFSVLVGIIGGVLPAIQASKLNPVEAMRK